MARKQEDLSNETLESFVVRPLSMKQLTQLYGVAKTTMIKWIAPFKDELGERRGWYYNIRQVNIIIRQLGTPDKLEEAEQKATEKIT